MPAPPTGSAAVLPAVQGRMLPFQRVASHVRQLLRRDKAQPGAPLPSEHDLAQRLDVSHMTVRKGLALLVEEGLIVRKVGKGTFVADADSAARTAAVKQRTIAVAVYESHRRMPFLGYGLQGARRVFDQQEFELTIFNIQSHGVDQNLIDLFKQCQVDGLLLHGHIFEDALPSLRDSGIPFVKIGWHDPPQSMPQVWFDMPALLDQVVAEAHRFGHRRVGMACWSVTPQLKPSTMTRLYAEACLRHGLGDCVDRIAPVVQILTSDPGDVDVQAIFAMQPLPTCLIVGDEIMALAVMRALERRGLRVPEDISVVSLFDGMPHAHRVPLTAPDSVAESTEIFHMAAALLQEYMDGRQRDPVRRLRTCKLHLKASLGPPPRPSDAPPPSSPHDPSNISLGRS